MYLSDENAIKVIQAATVLHNYLTPAHFNVETMMAQLNPGAGEYDHQAGALRNVNNHRGMRSPTDTMEIRNWYYTYFFNAVGAVPFQWKELATCELFTNCIFAHIRSSCMLHLPHS